MHTTLVRGVHVYTLTCIHRLQYVCIWILQLEYYSVQSNMHSVCIRGVRIVYGKCTLEYTYARVHCTVCIPTSCVSIRTRVIHVRVSRTTTTARSTRVGVLLEQSSSTSYYSSSNQYGYGTSEMLPQDNNILLEWQYYYLLGVFEIARIHTTLLEYQGVV